MRRSIRSSSVLQRNNSKDLPEQTPRQFASSQLNDFIQQISKENSGLKRCYSAIDKKSFTKFNQQQISKAFFRRLSATNGYSSPQIPKISLQSLKNPIIPSGPQFSFGTQQRSLQFQSIYSPGPGAYSQSAKGPTYKQTPSYAMRQKITDILVQKEINSVPGVGNYSFGSSLIKIGTRFGHAERESNQPIKKNSTISSASYNHQDVFKRLKSAYPAYSIPQTKKILITERISENKMRKTPGPGAYETKTAKGQSYSFGSKLLNGVFDMYCKPRIAVPGPGGYEVLRKAREGKKAESYVFGTQEKFRKIKQSPGPGDYNIGRDYPNKFSNSQYEFY